MDKLAQWKAAVSALELIPCRPPLWASGGHRQTIWGNYAPSPEAPPAEDDVTIPLPDGDTLVVHHYTTPGAKVVLYLFHGLGGHGRADYINRKVLQALKRGYHVYAANHRGCGDGELLASEPYHSGRGEDLGAVIAMGRKRHPDCFHVAVGFSLSGNALLLLSSGARGDCPPDMAVAVNAPIRLDRSSLMLNKGLTKIYDMRFTLKLRRDLKRRFQKGALPELRKFPMLMSLRDFDDLYTAPKGGFQNKEHYYAACSAAPHLHKIKIPTVLMTAKDDPMVDYRAYQDAELSPSVHLHIEARGGHMGYMHHKATPLGTRRWMDYAVDRYITTSLESLLQ